MTKAASAKMETAKQQEHQPDAEEQRADQVKALAAGSWIDVMKQQKSSHGSNDANGEVHQEDPAP
jgi:hypothetical protein